MKLTGHKTAPCTAATRSSPRTISATRARSAQPCSERRRSRLRSLTIPGATRWQRKERVV